MGSSIIKVIDSTTGKLKRWENADGKPLATVESGKLVLTSLGMRLGYEVKGMRLTKYGMPVF